MTTAALRATLLALASFALCHCDDSNGNDNGRDGGSPDASALDGGALDASAGAQDGGDGGGTCAGCIGTRAYDAQSYALRGKFDWGARKLIAEEEITVTLTSGQSVVALDAAVDVKRVSGRGGDLKWAYDAKAHVLHVDLGPIRGDGGGVLFVVSYEAALSSSLVASKGRDGDPVQSRVVFTNSEPDEARNWLVSNDHPSDRALWSVELTVGAGEDVIANGERTRDVRSGDARIVGYEMPVTLPTYLMAFAAGQIEHTDDETGRFPLSVWYRSGLTIDAAEHLKLLARLTSIYEPLIGKYPFDPIGYSVVLLPDFSGGMENATITFNSESSGQGTVSFNLNAHEYAHHWFGDWVTMRDYDDVWFKEGMATLMATEASRAVEDTEPTDHPKRLLGSDFTPSSSASVVDKSLKGIAKYTSGPYDRAAWMITQIRAKVGDDAFWKSLRDMLESHRAGTIDGEEFVRSFPLPEPAVQTILASLEKKPMPTVAIDVPSVDAGSGDAGLGDAGSGRTVTLTLGDPSSALLDPIPVTVIGESGKVEQEGELSPGRPLTFTVPPGGYLAYDERDVNPSWDESFDGDPAIYKDKLLPLMVPSSPSALATFAARSATHQARVLAAGILPPMAGEQLADFYEGLDSQFAKRSAEMDACQTMQRIGSTGGDTRAWSAALGSILKTPATVVYSTNYASCGPALASSLFSDEWKAPITAQNLGFRAYMLGFDYGPDDSLSLGQQLATRAPSLGLRELAIRRLASQAAGGAYSTIPSDRIAAWQAFFRDRLSEITSQTRFRYVWNGIRELKDEGALTAVAMKLHSVPLSASTQKQTVCEAYGFIKSAAVRDQFREAARPWDTLAPTAAEVLQDPSKCPKKILAVPTVPARSVPARAEAKGAREEKR